MSVLQDFNNLHINTKTFLFGLVLICPFWFVDLYLFHKTFFHTNPIYLPIVFSYCLSLCMFIPVYLGTFGYCMVIFKKSATDTLIFGLSIVLCLIILAWSSFETYTGDRDFPTLILEIITYTSWVVFPGMGIMLVKLILEVIIEYRQKRTFKSKQFHSVEMKSRKYPRLPKSKRSL